MWSELLVVGVVAFLGTCFGSIAGLYIGAKIMVRVVKEEFRVRP